MNNRPSTSTAVATSPLFSLPAELRNIIYKEVLHRHNGIYVKTNGITEPALLLTCKAIRSKTLPLYYTINNFYVPYPDFSSTAAYHWTQQKVRPLRSHHNIVVQERGCSSRSEPNWDNLALWLRRHWEGSVVEKMESLPWEEVREVLKEQRRVQIKRNWWWNLDWRLGKAVWAGK
ncbi:hypothetical protein LTR37_008025 [Vermiconidia calcicola]|uniref:Uncharacterized protein n=1 Tax=Vermiconidia calcicola TaxID=1690605 RepID=A0ACC3NDV0_9PEZI|nr:hypothetical protein LTR37_008025 [Vermiconidia calcicola]